MSNDSQRMVVKAILTREMYLQEGCRVYAEPAAGTNVQSLLKLKNSLAPSNKPRKGGTMTLSF